MLDKCNNSEMMFGSSESSSYTISGHHSRYPNILFQGTVNFRAMAKRTTWSSLDPKEKFFAGLPVDCFTEYEDDILDVLQLLSNLMSTWFPRSVSLQEWADRRIPPNLASSLNGSGIIYVEAVRSNNEDQDAPSAEYTKLHHYKRLRTEVIEGETGGWSRIPVTQHAQQQNVDNGSSVEEEASDETEPERDEYPNGLFP